MARVSGSQKSYSHRCEYLPSGAGYLISWMVDYKYKGSRLRYPRRMGRITDERGAQAFCKRWGIDPPADHPLSESERRHGIDGF